MELGEQTAYQCPFCPRARRYWADAFEIPDLCSCGQRLQKMRARRQVWKSGFTTKKEAEAALTAALAKSDSGTFVAAQSLTVGEYLIGIWLPSKAPVQDGPRKSRGRVGPQTWDGYRIYCEKYIVPDIGDTKLVDLEPHHLERLYDHLEQHGGRSRQGLAAKTLVNVHGIVTKALRDAVKRGLLGANPADRVERPTSRRPSTEVWTIAQLRAFLRHVNGHDVYAGWLLFATTGMRRGEVAGLSWEDIDLDGKSLTVRWTLGVVGNKPTWKFGAKTEAGDRRIALDPETVEALRRHRAQQAADRLALGPGWLEDNEDWRRTSRSGVVFTWPDGRMIHPERWSRWFLDAAQELALPRIRLHDLRHTYATAALQAADGWHDVKIISQRLGHASVGITLDRYSHVLPAADAETADTLAKLILND